MVDTNELKDRFDALYSQMATSNNVEDMKLFGSIAKKMMYNLIENKPDEAEEYIDILCAMNWHNYLTDREASEIVSRMKPSVEWGKQQFLSVVDKLGVEKEVEPYYNANALYVTSCMKYSDHGKRIAAMLGVPFEQAAGNEKFIQAVVGFAIDSLRDQDHVFNIREYFKL